MKTLREILTEAPNSLTVYQHIIDRLNTSLKNDSRKRVGNTTDIEKVIRNILIILHSSNVGIDLKDYDNLLSKLEKIRTLIGYIDVRKEHGIKTFDISDKLSLVELEKYAKITQKLLVDILISYDIDKDKTTYQIKTKII